MPEEIQNVPKPTTKSRKKLIIGMVAVLLLASAGLTLGRSINFGEITSRLTGNLVTSRIKYGTPIVKNVAIPKLSVFLNPTLSPGSATSEINLIGFSLTADKTGAVNVSKINFKTTGTLTPSQYTLYRGDTAMMASSIPSFALPKVETIAAGNTQKYRISATLSAKSPDPYSATAIEYGDIIADQDVSGLPIRFEIGNPPVATPIDPATQAIKTSGEAECVVDGGGGGNTKPTETNTDPNAKQRAIICN